MSWKFSKRDGNGSTRPLRPAMWGAACALVVAAVATGTPASAKRPKTFRRGPKLDPSALMLASSTGVRIYGQSLAASRIRLLGNWQARDATAAGAGQSVTEVVVSGGQRSLLKLAVPPLSGKDDGAQKAQALLQKDFGLAGLFEVLDPKSFVANLPAEGMSIDPPSWRSVGAQGVVKGQVIVAGGSCKLDLRLFVVSRGTEAVVKREGEVPCGDPRRVVHPFVNDVIKWFTGTPGSFGTRLVYSATTGKGEKGIFSIDSDGESGARLTAASNVALAPVTGPGGIYYAGGLPDGSYALFKVGSKEALGTFGGHVFGVAFGAGQAVLAISRGADTDLFMGPAASLIGATGRNASPPADFRKVTSGGLHIHPAIGPGGQLAYAASTGGSPQIFVDGRRVTSRGSYNTAPVWCNHPEGLRILYMGREGSNWDIFSVSPSGDGASVRRLTQDQGSNTYPACSPDGRLVAYFSTRGGLYVANADGTNAQKVAAVTGESLRWEGN